jgi:hypothetical protein
MTASGPSRGPDALREDRPLAIAAGRRGANEAVVAPTQDPSRGRGAQGRLAGIELQRAQRSAQAQNRAGPVRNQRFAQARTGPEPRAQFNFRDHATAHGPPAFSGPRLRAAEQARPSEPARAPRDIPAAMASRQFQPHAPAPHPQEAPHLHIVQAAPQGGRGHPNGGGGGNHPAPPQPHPGNDSRH